MISHLWSLAVEEQFYLFWPWFILFVNKKFVLPIILVFIFIGTVSQYLMRSIPMSSVLTFTCFDAFGLGALLSWISTYKNMELQKFNRAFSVAAVVSLLLFIMGLSENNWTIIPLRTLISIISLSVITYIIINYESKTLKFKFILNNRLLIFLGKISYGLYLYHNIILCTLNTKIINVYFNPLLPDIIYKQHWGLLILIENIVLLIIISWLSYLLIEKPFLNLKKYFG